MRHRGGGMGKPSRLPKFGRSQEEIHGGTIFLFKMIKNQKFALGNLDIKIHNHKL